MWLYLRKVANQLTLLIWTQQKNVLEAGAAAAVTPGLEYEEEEKCFNHDSVHGAAPGFAGSAKYVIGKRYEQFIKGNAIDNGDWPFRHTLWM